MTRQTNSPKDAIEREIETSLKPGVFVSDRDCYAFTNELDKVVARLAKLTESEPARAVALYEVFLAGCYQKIEEVDDSSAWFAQLVEELFCGWIKARQAAGADSGDTAARLLAWMDDDPYGFCFHLDQGAVRVLDKAGLAAFEGVIRERLDDVAPGKAPSGEPPTRAHEHEGQRWTDVLRTIYLAQNNLAAYLALADAAGLTAQDCYAVATLLLRRRKATEALSWVERGLAIAQKDPHAVTGALELERLRRELLTKLGRREEAIQTVWAAYQKAPSKYTYTDLIHLVPKAEREAWHKRALEVAEQADLATRMELFLETKELGRLAELVGSIDDQSLERLSHYTTEPAAQKLEKAHPYLAARLWRAQGMRIVNAKKSKYYDAALSNFECAMRCFSRAGQPSEWAKTVQKVRAEHHRKSGFLAGFEELVSGNGPSKLPSFLEHAKTQFQTRYGEHP